jgi:ABC-type antimicrobial peptide transport system ATPase subunit
VRQHVSAPRGTHAARVVGDNGDGQSTLSCMLHVGT